MPHIVLASKSPRRHELLRRMGITDFSVVVPDVEETYPEGLAPQEIVAAREWRDQALALAPSWVLSAEGVALLSAWVEADVTEYLAQLRTRLRALRQRQHRGLLRRGWRVEPSDCGFALWQPPQTALAPLLQALRGVGIKLRDAESLGAPGRVRISVQPVAAQRALWAALDAFKEQAR